MAVVNVARGHGVRAARRAATSRRSLQLIGRVGRAGAAARSPPPGTFALLGNVFGITTSYQLLELANPPQPLLRRLLLETPGTYHHSLMVGNLARAGRGGVGADPLLARVAAYYHDVGKLADPAGVHREPGRRTNLHDELPPEESAAMLAGHVAAASTSPTSTSCRSRSSRSSRSTTARGSWATSMRRPASEAVADAGAAPGTARRGGRRATRRTSAASATRGPKPQTREAAILMLADSVEASVRSLVAARTSRPSGRWSSASSASGSTTASSTSATSRCATSTGSARRSSRSCWAMYHRRIEYPQNKIVELESRRSAGRPSA